MSVAERQPEKDQRRLAAILLVLAWVFRLHRWVPAVLVAAFVSWVVLHSRLEDGRGVVLARLWRRAWPPAPSMLMALLTASTIVFIFSDISTTAKVMPVALGVFALSSLLVGRWWTLFALPWWLGGDRPSPLHFRAAPRALHDLTVNGERA